MPRLVKKILLVHINRLALHLLLLTLSERYSAKELGLLISAKEETIC